MTASPATIARNYDLLAEHVPSLRITRSCC